MEHNIENFVGVIKSASGLKEESLASDWGEVPLLRLSEDIVMCVEASYQDKKLSGLNFRDQIEVIKSFTKEKAEEYMNYPYHAPCMIYEDFKKKVSERIINNKKLLRSILREAEFAEDHYRP
ncbi:MAG: hypothetical protein ABH828_01840 [archaeon]